MTGERSLKAVIVIFWIAAALVAVPGVLELASGISAREPYYELWGQVIRVIAQTLWFAGPAFFLARGSRVARWFAIAASLITLAGTLILAMALIAYGGALFEDFLIAALAVPFLFSSWALLFHRGLREALAQRLKAWNAAEEARLRQLYDSPGEASEK
jgi:hypothetical protein